MPGNISARDLKTALNDGGELALLDVREAGQFGLDHMLHAVPCPYSMLEARVSQLVPRHTVRMVLVDQGDGVAQRAAQRLGAMGYSDIALLAGGNPSWRAAGFEVFQGVNVPSKAFGEVVEHIAGTPHIDADELHDMKSRGEDLVILDGRTPVEHQRMSIPGGMSVPNAEMVYRIHDLAPDPDTTIVVNCAGRTRSIIGAQALINAGVPNRVVALKAGTMGWTLAGHTLEHGSQLRYPEQLTSEGRHAAATYARRMMKKFSVPAIASSVLAAWREDPDRTLFLFDVRSEAEYLAGHVEGSVHAPGGQLVQATDHWCGVWGARIVLLDTAPCTRAIVTAHWLRQMGWDVSVLEEGIAGLPLRAGPESANPVPSSQPALTTTEELAGQLAAGNVSVIDVGYSMDYRKAHIPGASWAIRPALANIDAPPSGPVVMCSKHETRARLAVIDMEERGIGPVSVLKGGRAAWIAEGRTTETTPDCPSDEAASDFLFWVSARHQGSDDAARAYLEWEENLPAQIEADGDARFRVL